MGASPKGTRGKNPLVTRPLRLALRAIHFPRKRGKSYPDLMPARRPPTESSPAYKRFKESMHIDYGKWRDGEPYDIPALAEVTPEERNMLVDELLTMNLDWREIEALRALGTPKALKRVGQAAKEDEGGGAAEALVAKVEDEGWSDETEEDLIRQLENMRSMEGSSDRLFDLCEEHPTPKVMEQLMRSARIQSDEAMRYSAGALLLYLTGHAEDRHGLNEHRPMLLELNSSDYKTYKATVAWLEDLVVNPKR
jgi:hypothetical protein